MANLNTKTLNELTIIEEMGENDKILVESDGDMKKYSIVRNNVYILDATSWSYGEEIHNTTLYNSLLQALDAGKTIYICNDGFYMILYEFTYYNSPSIYIGGATIYPSEGQLSSDLYEPVNFIQSPHPAL